MCGSRLLSCTCHCLPFECRDVYLHSKMRNHFASEFLRNSMNIRLRSRLVSPFTSAPLNVSDATFIKAKDVANDDENQPVCQRNEKSIKLLSLPMPYHVKAYVISLEQLQSQPQRERIKKRIASAVDLLLNCW